MFKRIHLTLFYTKCTHFKFDACHRSQKSWHRGNKGLTFFKYSAGRTSVTGLAIKKERGRGSAICERVCKKIVEYFKNKIKHCSSTSNCKGFANLIIYSAYHHQKIQRNWINLCVRDKPEDYCWMPLVFGPSDYTASLISMILSLKLLNGPRNTSRNHCR